MQKLTIILQRNVDHKNCIIEITERNMNEFKISKVYDWQQSKYIQKMPPFDKIILVDHIPLQFCCIKSISLVHQPSMEK